MKRRTTRDERDPLVPLTPAMFGPPPRAAQCAACGRWFPFANFLRGDGKARRRVKRCQECIKAHKPASGLATVLGAVPLPTAAAEPTRPAVAPLRSPIVSRTARKRAAAHP